MNHDAIAKHLAALDAALTDEAAFLRAFDALKADPAMKAPETKALAKMFARWSAHTKRGALNAIWARHAALMLEKAKAAATAGRTAA